MDKTEEKDINQEEEQEQQEKKKRRIGRPCIIKTDKAKFKKEKKKWLLIFCKFFISNYNVNKYKG